MRLPHILRALGSRNYRLFFCGQSISLIGNWMTITASGWLIYELSHSAFYVGLSAFFTQIPLLVLAPFTGVWVDRINRHRTFIILQVLALLQSSALAAITLSGNMSVPILLGLCVCQGLINAWEFPVRQSLIIAFVDDRAHLSNAIALGSSIFNLARMSGPALAGFAINQWGAGGCYLIDAVSYIPVIATLTAMRLPPRLPPAKSKAAWTDLREGLGYVRRHPQVRLVLTLVPVIALTGWAASVLAPVFARDVYHGDARLLGFMLSSIGIGALAGAVALGMRSSTRGSERMIATAILILAAGELTYALSPWLPLSLAALAACGFGGVRAMAGSNTWIQSLIDDDKRGRVMGLFAMGQGMFPVGSLIAGILASRFGPRPAVAAAAIAAAIAGAVFIRASGAFAPRPSRPPEQPTPLPSNPQG